MAFATETNAWVDRLVQTCLPLDLQKKLLSDESLTKEEADQFCNVLLLARQHIALKRQGDMSLQIDRQADRICAAIPSREEISTIVSDQLTKTSKPISKGEGVRAKPKKARRGPKVTSFMLYQRNAIIEYVEGQCHRPLSTLSIADCHHVWNLPRNKATWDKRAKLKNSQRGYSNPKALFRALKRQTEDALTPL